MYLVALHHVTLHGEQGNRFFVRQRDLRPGPCLAKLFPHKHNKAAGQPSLRVNCITPLLDASSVWLACVKRSCLQIVYATLGAWMEQDSGVQVSCKSRNCAAMALRLFRQVSIAASHHR